MTELFIPDDKDIEQMASLYVNTMLQEPWFEDNDADDVISYFRAFTDVKSRFIYGLKVNGNIAGVAVGESVPCTKAPFLRIEDFCIDYKMHLLGLGSAFITMIEDKARSEGCNCVLISTARDFAPHFFYSKNGYNELENSVYLYKEI